MKTLKQDLIVKFGEDSDEYQSEVTSVQQDADVSRYTIMAAVGGGTTIITGSYTSLDYALVQNLDSTKTVTVVWKHGAETNTLIVKALSFILIHDSLIDLASNITLTSSAGTCPVYVVLAGRR